MLASIGNYFGDVVLGFVDIAEMFKINFNVVAGFMRFASLLPPCMVKCAVFSFPV